MGNTEVDFWPIKKLYYLLRGQKNGCFEWKNLIDKLFLTWLCKCNQPMVRNKTKESNVHIQYRTYCTTINCALFTVIEFVSKIERIFVKFSRDWRRLLTPRCIFQTTLALSPHIISTPAFCGCTFCAPKCTRLRPRASSVAVLNVGLLLRAFSFSLFAFHLFILAYLIPLIPLHVVVRTW